MRSPGLYPNVTAKSRGAVSDVLGRLETLVSSDVEDRLLGMLSVVLVLLVLFSSLDPTGLQGAFFIVSCSVSDLSVMLSSRDERSEIMLILVPVWFHCLQLGR